MNLQTTLACSATLTGIGIHTGNPSTVTFRPAPADTGRVIIRMDLPGQPRIHPAPELVSQTSRGTTIREKDAEVHTVEHVLAALAGLGIDNCWIELTANEPPIMDGSAKPFVDVLTAAGKEEIPGAEQEVFSLDQPITLAQEGKSIVGWPYPGLRITYCLEYDHPWLSPQRVELEISGEAFRKWVAPARTYCFDHEIAWLHSQGLARGGSVDNALIVTREGLQNGPLRSEYELAYHKILDFIGDLALLGCPVRGHFVARRSGHALNAQLVQHLKNIKNRERERRRKGSVIINAKEIEQLLPHRYPMLLVDRVIDLEEGKRVVGIKNVTMNEQFFQGHFPGHPIMPGVLIVEAMAQCGGVLLMKSFPDAAGKVVYFMSIDNVKFRRPVLPGDQLRFELTVEKIKSKIAKMHGNAFVGEDLVCEADLTSMLIDK